jgi:hypothetical protein
VDLFLDSGVASNGGSPEKLRRRPSVLDRDRELLRDKERVARY